MPWGKRQMQSWLALRGWRVTRAWPSGRVRIMTPRGKLCECASLEKAFNAIRAWMEAKALRMAMGKKGTASRSQGGEK